MLAIFMFLFIDLESWFYFFSFSFSNRHSVHGTGEHSQWTTSVIIKCLGIVSSILIIHKGILNLEYSSTVNIMP